MVAVALGGKGSAVIGKPVMGEFVANKTGLDHGTVGKGELTGHTTLRRNGRDGGGEKKEEHRQKCTKGVGPGNMHVDERVDLFVAKQKTSDDGSMANKRIS